MTSSLPTSRLEEASAGARLLAFVVDIKVLVLWGSALFAATLVAPSLFAAWPETPLGSQAAAFCVMTLPFWFYLTVTEAGSRHASLGKLLPGLTVRTVGGAPISFGRAALRNACKLLPWEIGHVVPHQLMAAGDADPPVWVMALAWGSMGMALIYAGSLFVGSGRTPYDRVAGTTVWRRANSERPAA